MGKYCQEMVRDYLGIVLETIFVALSKIWLGRSLFIPTLDNISLTSVFLILDTVFLILDTVFSILDTVSLISEATVFSISATVSLISEATIFLILFETFWIVSFGLFIAFIILAGSFIKSVVFSSISLTLSFTLSSTLSFTKTNNLLKNFYIDCILTFS